MKLTILLDNLNSLEKNPFVKILDGIISNNPKNEKQIDKLLSQSNRTDLKHIDSILMSKLFEQVHEEFSSLVFEEFRNTTNQIDILIDILTRDGNCIMKLDWFARLYENELTNISRKVKEVKNQLNDPNSELSITRKRDYSIYKACVDVAYHNDLTNNRESKITDDELSILNELIKQLELSQEEVKLLNYLVLPPSKKNIDEVVNDLKSIGIIFYSKKNNTIYVANEMVRLLRKLRNKEIADKHFRRILRLFKEPHINIICRKHNINWRLDFDTKVKEVIKEGISIREVLTEGLYKDSASLTERKSILNDLWEKKLKLGKLSGSTVDEKVENIINHFLEVEKDDKVGISIDGYEKLLIELNESIQSSNDFIKKEFELQEEFVMSSKLLLDYNIKPKDVLEILPMKDIERFCSIREISTRGSEIDNILNAYENTENLYLENYVNIGFRNFNALRENNIKIKESEIGSKFEELTKLILEQLGLNVDEELRKKLNTKKDKIDIVINLGNNEIIIVECKTVKESGYNKYSSVSRQLKAYTQLAKLNDYTVIKSLLIAPDFSDDFINDTDMELELNLSLMKAKSLLDILESFKASQKHKSFPYKLLLRDVLIQEDRIIKAINK